MRLLFLLSVALAVGVPLSAVGEVIYVEDFEDAAGNPAFDPMFDGELSRFDLEGQAIEPNWNFHEDPTYFPDNGVLLGLYARTRYAARFNLGADSHVGYASIEFYVWPYAPSGLQYHYVDFVGSETEQRVYLESPPLGSPRTLRTLTCSSEAIGWITEIRMCAVEGLFDNLTIGVVPEPCSPVVLFVLLVYSVCTRRIRRE